MTSRLELNSHPLARTIYVCLIVAFLISIVAGCDSCTEVSEPRYTVGVILASSGGASFIGEPEKAVLEGLMQQYEETGVGVEGLKLDIKDSAGKVEQAIQLFERFAANDNVVAVIGPSTSGESIQLAQMADEAEVPLLSLAASRKIVEPEPGQTRRWVYKFAQNDDLAAERLASSMRSNGDLSVAFFYENSGFGRSGENVFKEASGNAGIEINYDASFSGDNAEEFASNLPPDTDAVVIWGTAPGPALLVRALRKEGFNGGIYLSHGNASLDFVESAGASAEGAIIVGSRVLMPDDELDSSSSRDRVILQYREFWNQHTGGVGPPSHFGGHARDALEALVSVLEDVDEGGATPVREQIRSGLEGSGRSFEGVTGTFTFTPDDHAGLGLNAFATYRIANGAFVVVDEELER